MPSLSRFSAIALPPLSARKCIDLATTMRKKIVVDKDEWKWSLESISLVNLGSAKWVWIANFEAHIENGAATGIPPNLKLVVLMNGVVPDPKAFDD